MTLWSRCSRPMFLGLLAALAATDVAAAEIKIMTPRSMWTVLKEIGPEFERSLRLQTQGRSPTSPPRWPTALSSGESFDVFVGPPVQIDRLIKNNKIVAGTRTPIARSGIGVEVRAGTPRT